MEHKLYINYNSLDGIPISKKYRSASLFESDYCNKLFHLTVKLGNLI